MELSAEYFINVAKTPSSQKSSSQLLGGGTNQRHPVLG